MVGGLGYSYFTNKSSGTGNDTKLTKADLESALDRANSEIVDLEAKVEELEKTLQVLAGGDVTSIDSIDVGGDDSILKAINGKVIFSKNLEYPGVEQSANESSLNLSSRIKVTPSVNWVVKMGGTKTDYVHPTGVRGTITLGNAKTMYKTDELEVTLDEFLGSINATNIVKGKVFLNGTERGVEAKINVIIGNRPYKARVGTLGYNGQVITFMFYYEGDTDANKDELINTLLSSIRVGEQILSIN